MKVISSKYKEVSILYDELKIQYDELKEEYDNNIKETLEINEEDIEQELFKLVNEERTNAELDELIWNEGLHSSAQGNNRKMAEAKSIVPGEGLSYQQVFWFLGNGKAERIASAALQAWQNNPYSYNQNILTDISTHGAVAAYKSEDILYITFESFTDAPTR